MMMVAAVYPSVLSPFTEGVPCYCHEELPTCKRAKERTRKLQASLACGNSTALYVVPTRVVLGILRGIVPLKQIEYSFGYIIIIRSPYTHILST